MRGGSKRRMVNAAWVGAAAAALAFDLEMENGRADLIDRADDGA